MQSDEMIWMFAQIREVNEGTFGVVILAVDRQTNEQVRSS
jgi:hypothetical protein